MRYTADSFLCADIVASLPAAAHGPHAATRLPGLAIDSCNLTVRDPRDGGFLGDRASQTAFRDLLDEARQQCTGPDPFGDVPSQAIPNETLDLILVGGDADAAHVVHVAIERYARRLAKVIAGFLAQPGWEDVEAIVLGGGFVESHFGALAIRRTARLLPAEHVQVVLSLLGHDADEAALLGWVQLLPEALQRDYDAFLAVDVGGTNLRCGIVEHALREAPDGANARTLEHMHWRHAEDEPGRDEAVLRMAGMLNGLTAQARTLGLKLAPFVGIACPGVMQPDGSIVQGAQNLPGDWEAPFNLPRALAARLDPIGSEAPQVVMHNDAVVQGLSERARMRDARRWAVLTIGTGLGNASYRNLAARDS